MSCFRAERRDPSFAVRTNREKKALSFLKFGGKPESLAILNKALDWSRRRKLVDLATAIEATIEGIPVVN